MDIINVIETKNGIIDNITSFPINSKDEEDLQARNAEQHFLHCVREQGCEETDEEILDMDNWDNMNGYDISIVWSHNVKTHM